MRRSNQKAIALITSNSGTLPSAVERLQWADVAKGIAIILVVFGHMLGGLMAAKLISGQPYAKWLYDWIYLFHMPVFFIVSGWVVEVRAAAGRPLSPQSVGATLLYPYFLWGAITWALHRAGDYFGITNHQVGAWVPWHLHYPSLTGPWFLLVLAIFHLFFWVTNASPARQFWCLLGGFISFDLLVLGENVRADSLTYLCGVNFIFYTIGIFGASRGVLHSSRTLRRWIIFPGVTLLTVTAALAWFNRDLPLWSKLPLGLIGSGGVLLVSLGLSSCQWLALLGRCSLGIYLLHGFVLPVIRWCCMRLFGDDSGLWMLAAGTVAGVLCPLAIVVLVERWNLKWVFRIGNSRSASLNPTAKPVLQHSR